MSLNAIPEKKINKINALKKKSKEKKAKRPPLPQTPLILSASVRVKNYLASNAASVAN